MATYREKIVHDRDGNKYHRVVRVGSEIFFDIPESNWSAFLNGDFWAGEDWDEGPPTIIEWSDVST